MQIQPLSDRVLLRGVEAEMVTKSGIYLPENANKERPHIYEVVAIGPGKKDKDGNTVTIDLKVGDQVISGQYSGDEVEVNKLKYKIVGYEYILAKVIK
ncbi:MAG: co-chaperone GroES [Candidatus Gracilibacteria bacterium]|nr:co-chaperone GroES [Candidatus Gracilibacteria bacterium]